VELDGAFQRLGPSVVQVWRAGLGLDPISWTSSEGRIRWPEWDQAAQDRGRDGSSLTSLGPALSGWCWTKGNDRGGRPLYEKTNIKRQPELVSYVLRECERRNPALCPTGVEGHRRLADERMRAKGTIHR
jgi:hypothetical protein